jgi:hypothetical protein
MVALSSLAGAGWQFFGNNGLPLAGGKLYTYAAGTTTPLATYTSISGATPHANPIIMDSAGRVPSEIWLTTTATYKFVLKTSADVEIWTKDNIPGIFPNNGILPSSQISFTGFNGNVGFVSDLATSNGSDWIGFTPAGTNVTPRSAQNKMRDIYSSADVGISSSGDQSTNFANLVTNLITTKQVGNIGVGTFSISSTVNVNGNGNTLSGFVGEAPERTVFQVTANNINGVQLKGQYLTAGGFTVQYSTQQGRTNTASAAVLISDSTVAGFSFGSADRIFVKNAYYGIRFNTTAGSQQNNNFGTLRASNCYAACFDFASVGSGSFYASLYASNLLIPNVLSIARFSEHSGSAGLLNAEQSCVAGIAVDFPLANNFTIDSLHCEQLSFMRNGTTLDPLATCGFAQSSGQGVPSIGSWAIDSSHVGALIVKTLTLSGGTARAYLNSLGLDHKKYSQSAGIEVGDNVFIEGADTGTSNEYNGAHIVTAIGATEISPGVYTDQWVEFTLAGSPASPADIAAGSSCITASRGNLAVSTIPLVVGIGRANKFEIERLYTRDIKVVGSTASRRQNMFRFLSGATTSSMDLQIGEISTEGQRTVASFWLAPRIIAGYSRAANVTTVYFARQHGLRADTPLNIYGASDASFNGNVTTTLTYVSPYSISFAQTGSDTTLTQDNAARAILRTYAIATVARASNYATITFTADHGLLAAPTGVGLQIAIRAQDSAYTTDNELILEVPSSTSIVVRNVGANEATKADTGCAMLMEGGLSETALTLNNPFGQLLLPDAWTTYQAILPTTAINAGVTTTLSTDTVIRAAVGRNTVEILSVVGGDPRLIYTGVVSGAQQVQIKATNPTAGTITPSTAAVVIYRVNGG